MAIFSAQDLCLSFGDSALLDKSNFSIHAKDRIGLIGRNGSGKSSLLKIISQTISPDSGDIKYRQGLKIAYVGQESSFNKGMTISEAIASTITDYTYIKQYNNILETNYNSPQLHTLQNILDEKHLWELPNKIKNIAEQIGLQATNLVDNLSGGERKRISIASGLVQNPDILLLDEPTNHLDMHGIEWLEQTLKDSNAAIILISHDRYFLDKVCTKIIELDRAKLHTFNGNFAYYQRKKEEILHNQNIENAKFDKLLSQEEIWIRKGVEARRTKGVARIERLKTMREEYSSRRKSMGNIKLELAQGEKSGKIVAELTDVNKTFTYANANNTSKIIAKNLNITIMRGDKIGIIGDNGIGKSTLVKILLGEINPDSGKVKLGTNLQISYFDQMRQQLDLNKTLSQTISPGSDWIDINGKRKHIIAYLNDFLFSAKMVDSPVSSLSGGERNRLLLAHIFAKPSNVLVLDEPTNDLDIQTLELLEEKVDEYAGTILLISHDRYFLDNIVNYILAPNCSKPSNNGEWVAYIGGYTDYLRQANITPNNLNKPPIKIDAKLEKGEVGKEVKINTNNKKLNYNQKRELEQLPQQIEAIELEQKKITEQMNDSGLYQDGEQAQKIAQRYAELEQDLTAKLERWEFLEQLQN